MRSSARLQRSRQDRLIAGVAGGLGARLGVDPVLVRLALVFLSVAAFLGVVIYGVAWSLSTEPAVEESEAPIRTSTQQAVALGLIVLGVALGARRVGLWLGDTLALPVGLGVLGSAILHGRGDATSRWLSGREGARPLRGLVAGDVSLWRTILGVTLVMGGAVVFLGRTGRLDALGDVLLSGAVLGAGLLLLFGPLASRTLGELVEERRQRIRSEERADLAAHLHDSVLQTLALIQRTDDPNRIAALARRQERELRAWLYGATPTDAGTLEAAVARVVEDAETEHAVTVEAVIVGDRPLDATTGALVRAVQEAIRNAARYARGPVAVFVESGADGIEAFVRDRGPGFDLEAVPEDRRGIRDSIVGRVERRGGTASIETGPDGTEVTLWVPHGAEESPVARSGASTHGAEQSPVARSGASTHGAEQSPVARSGASTHGAEGTIT